MSPDLLRVEKKLPREIRGVGVVNAFPLLRVDTMAPLGCKEGGSGLEHGSSELGMVPRSSPTGVCLCW